LLPPVRNRARELVELLSDVETIRTERRKAKAGRGKYVGTGNDPMSFSSGGSRYGGFGSEGLGGGSGYYGDRMSGRDGKRGTLSSLPWLIRIVRLWGFRRLQG
jgi:epsin